MLSQKESINHDILKNIHSIILYSFLSGITIFLGGLLGNYFENYDLKRLTRSGIIHTSIAFGGGILIAAVSLVLVPQGMLSLSLWPMAGLFFGGAITFFFIDRQLEQKKEPFSQVMAMLLDYIPEAIALGAVFAANENLGLLLALFIAFQNFPESFNAFVEMRKGGYSAKTCLKILALLSFVGIAASVSGFYFLSSRPLTTASLMLFSSGGIVYLIFQDIAPMSKMNRKWLPALGASFGFLAGMIGKKLLG